MKDHVKANALIRAYRRRSKEFLVSQKVMRDEIIRLKGKDFMTDTDFAMLVWPENFPPSKEEKK